MVVYAFYEMDNRVRRYAETLARRGDTVDVVSLRQNGQSTKNQLNGVSVFRIQKRDVNERTNIDYLFRILMFLFNSFCFISLRHLKARYDIVHVHSVPDFEVFSAIVPKLMGAKIILDIHDLVPEFYASKFNSGRDNVLTKWLKIIERICCTFSDHVIISNHIWEECLIARSVKKEKCTVILNYPDQYLFHRTRPKKHNDKFIVMYPGTISLHQGIDVAIHAMNIVCKKNKNIEFHIYGKGPYEIEMAQLIKDYNISDYIKWGGKITLDDVVEKMMDVDLGVVPKRNDNFGGEAFSTKTLEFMAMGVPMLIAATKIDRYYFNDSIVTFFEPEDENDLAEKILMLADNSSHIKNQVEHALEYIKLNNWDVKKEEYLGLLTKLITKRR